MEENQQQQEQQEQIETVEKAQYDALVTELEEVKGKLPKELSDDEKAIQTKQAELFNKEVQLELKSAGLDKFASIVKVGDSDELQETIKTLSQIVNDIKVSTGYVPNDHKQQNEYDVFASKKDTKGMIGSKLANLFK